MHYLISSCLCYENETGDTSATRKALGQSDIRLCHYQLRNSVGWVGWLVVGCRFFWYGLVWFVRMDNALLLPLPTGCRYNA